MDVLADADGAWRALDRDLTGEQPLDDFEDEEGVLFVELPGGVDGLAERKPLDLDGRVNGIEAEAVGFGAVTGVGECGCDVERNGLAVAQDDESGGLALLVLQVGEQRGDGVELEAVDG